MSTKLFDLTGKTALLTGSSSGLGFAMARGLAEAGANVILNGRNKDKLHLAVEELNEQGLDVRGAAFDVTDESAVEQNIKGINLTGDPIDILVNCAGIIRRQPLEEFSLEDWQQVIEINLSGVFTVSKHVVKDMIQRESGKIINICSLMSEVGRNTTGAYTA
jgi:gluconate 5-dehydrogenase